LWKEKKTYRVILASRYGTCGLLQPLPRRLRPRSERARITLPRASRPVLMILLARSEPARSTRQSLDERTVFKDGVRITLERLEAFPISTFLVTSPLKVCCRFGLPGRPTTL
uniref:Uncharacterized protein n=1 Tax=Xiphophorus couchianus TaxID=32473 RepID=A0A3B5LA79_9TELE